MEITKFGLQLFVRLEQMAVHLRRTQNTLSRLRKSVTGKTQRLREALLARGNDLRALLASSVDAIVVTNGKIIKFSSELCITLEQGTVRLRRAVNTLAGLGRSVTAKTQRLREALLARENDLRALLASSVDAVVVTDVDGRFVEANPKASDLFGVSETNLKKFTVDVFLSRRQILYFEGNRSSFIRRKEGSGECKIRRLDGNLRLAEYIFVANFVPFRHLYRFRNDRQWAPRKRTAA
jgi:PAS domain S-box-containing protein